jgi:hypothetical protein
LLKTSGTTVQKVAFPVESILVDFVQEQTPRKKKNIIRKQKLGIDPTADFSSKVENNRRRAQKTHLKHRHRRHHRHHGASNHYRNAKTLLVPKQKQTH